MEHSPHFCEKNNVIKRSEENFTAGPDSRKPDWDRDVPVHFELAEESAGPPKLLPDSVWTWFELSYN